MYCTSTKVVVIGTNVKRKAGPRIGSIGYIIDISRGMQSPMYEGVVLFQATMIFTRYGYQNKERLEKKRILVAAPHIYQGVNCKKALNKCINTVRKNTDRRVPMVVVSPIEKNLSNKNEFYAKVLCKIANPDFKHAVNVMTYEYKHGGEHGFHKLENLTKVLTYPVNEFVVKWGKVKKPHELLYLIDKYFYNKPKNLEKLFLFINACEILAIRASHHRSMHPPGGPYMVYNTLFNINGFNRLMAAKNSLQRRELTQRFGSLAVEMVVKGNKTTQKHK